MPCSPPALQHLCSIPHPHNPARFLFYSLSCSLASSPREAIAALDHPGRPVLACSASGRSISAVWPQLRAYAVYSLAPTGAWEVVDRGEWLV